MKMRKLVAVLLAMLMLCTIIPFSAAAEGNSVTIDFTDKANRTAYSTEQQVWEQNGIVVTNDKGASTTNVGDYGGEGYPARFYKSSTVTIEYPGMTAIVIDCGDVDSKYISGWADSVSAGATAVVDGSIVTVTLDKAADAFVWETLTAQSRAYNITVYTDGSAPVVPPVEPEDPPVSTDPEADTVLTLAEAIALGSSKEHNTYTEGKYYISGCYIVDLTNSTYGNMIISDGTDTLTVYGTWNYDGSLRYDAMDVQLTVGDNVWLYGVIGQYNGTPQMKNGWIVDYIIGGTDAPGEGGDIPADPPVSGDYVTITFDDVENRVSVSTEQQVWMMNGITVTNDKGASTSNVNEKYWAPVRFYKSSDVTVEYPGMTKIVFHCNTAAYATALADALGVAAEDTLVTVELDGVDSYTCTMTVGQVRVDSIDVYSGESGGSGDGDTPVEPPVSDDTLTVEQAVAMGSAMEHNTYTEQKYYVTGVITEVYNTTWGNMYIADEAGTTLLIYGTYDADGTNRYDAMTVQPVAGDTVTIYGAIGQYNGTAQIKNGWVVEHTLGDGGGDTPAVPEPPVSGEIETDYPFLFGMIQYNVSEEDVYFLNGSMNGYYMGTTTDPDAAIVVYVEAAEGGYYFYTVDEKGTKMYINMTVNGTHVNGSYDPAPSTVYLYAEEYGTLVAEVNGAYYWFGTRNDNTYTTVGPCNIEYNGFYCEFYYFSEDCEHEYDAVEEAPTCGMDGAVIYTCLLCDDTYIEVIPATGEHTYDDDYDIDCNECGAVREVIIPAGSIVVSTTVGSVGNTVNVTVSVVDNPGLISAKVKVWFDPAVLKLVGYEAGNFSAGGYSWGDIEKVEDSFIINWCDAINPDCTADLLATLTFEVLEGAADGFTPITVTFSCDDDMFNATGETIWFEAVDGGVEIVTATYVPGDADGNNKVNNKDLGRLQQYLNGWDVSPDLDACDVDGNGKVNNKDLGRLQQYLNGWDVVLG